MRAAREAAFLPEAFGGLEALQAISSSEALSVAFTILSERLSFIAEASNPLAPSRDPSRKAASWWNSEVCEAVQAARRASRLAKQQPSHQPAADKLNRAKSRVIRRAQRDSWRSSVSQASSRNKGLWDLERWARLRSYLPTSLPKLPPLTIEGATASSFKDKATALAAKFFPQPPATTRGQYSQPAACLNIPIEVTQEDIQAILGRLRPFKAPGYNGIPACMLKACGKPLHQILAVLATKCFQLQYFPSSYKLTKTVVLAKPGKEPAVYSTPAGYRPIALLPTIGKVIESALAKKLATTTEDSGILPPEQFGCRKARSIEGALFLLVSQVEETFRHKASASLLQLDIQGAFDNFNHIELISTLKS